MNKTDQQPVKCTCGKTKDSNGNCDGSHNNTTQDTCKDGCDCK